MRHSSTFSTLGLLPPTPPLTSIDQAMPRSCMRSRDEGDSSDTVFREDRPPGNCNPLHWRPYLAGERTPQWALLAEPFGNAQQVHIVLPKGRRVRSGRLPPTHAQGRDFALRASRAQRLLDGRAIGGSRLGLTISSREIQPARSLSWFSGRRVPQNGFAPRLGATLASSSRNTKFWQ